MEPAEAALLVARWRVDYGFIVTRTLVKYRIDNRADRAELEQDVFLAALLTLRQGEHIDRPAAWLTHCAWKVAANYRRKVYRRKMATGASEAVKKDVPMSYEEIPSRLPSPEQLTEDRERLYLIWEGLDEEARSILLAVRGEGMDWQEVADERGLTIDQARYLYSKAVKKVEAILAKAEPETSKRRSIPVELLLLQLFDTLHFDLEESSPEQDRRALEALEQRMKAAESSDLDPEAERVSFAQPAPPSTQAPTPAFFTLPLVVHTALWLLGVGLGVAIFYLLWGTPRDNPPRDPVHTQAISGLALVEPTEPRRDPSVTAPHLPAIVSSAIPVVEPRLVVTQSARPPSAAAPREKASSSESRRLIDSARDAFRAGNVREALSRLSQHARRFPDKDTEDRRINWQIVCATPAARSVKECGSPPGSATE
jgi:RNA polymerase sigma factor (sigma-70 family)